MYFTSSYIFADTVLEKEYSKGNAVWAFDFNNGKMILILLIEIVTIYMKLIIIDIWGQGF